MSNRPLFRIVVATLLLALLLSACSPLQQPPAPAPALDTDRQPGLSETAFVPNAGQMNPKVLFHSLGSATTLYFALHEVILPLPSHRDLAQVFSLLVRRGTSEPALRAEPAILHLRFEGAGPATEVVGGDRLAGIVNHFVGNNPAHWRAGIPTFGTVTYRQLYPGIDLHYDGAEGVLKGTYQVAPGADAEAIRWRYDGASGLELKEGDLLIHVDETGVTPLIERKPVAWQIVSGEKRPVRVRYVLHGDGSVGFDLGRYDPTQTLMIDPTLDYYSYFGGSLGEGAYDIALDSNNNVYIAGRTNSPDLPPEDDDGHVGDFDIYVAKLDLTETGVNQLVYTTYVGGTGFDIAHGLVVDGAGNVCVVGYSDSDDFATTTATAYQASHQGQEDGVLVQLDTMGAVHYATYLGGTGNEQLMRVTLGDDGLAYAAGWSDADGFPTTQDAYQRTWASGGTDPSYLAYADAVVVVVDPSKSGTTSLVYSTYYGGTSHDEGYVIDVAAGIIYFAGFTGSTDLPLENPIQDQNMGGAYFRELFLAKLDRSKTGDNQLRFATYLGGKEGTGEWDPEEVSGGIVAEPSGIVHWVGATGSTDFPTTEASPLYGGGDFDAFLVKVDTTRSSLLVSRLFGGSGNDGFADLVLDHQGNIYVAGGTGSENLPTADPLQGSLKGGQAPEPEFSWYGPGDALIAKFTPSGAMTFSTWLGGSEVDTALGIALGTDGDVYVAGGTRSTGLGTANAFQTNHAGIYDSFVARIGDLVPSAESPQAEFMASPTSGRAPLEVTFTNLSTGDYTDSLWDFGDEITSTLESPTHTYSAANVYTVSLTVSGPGGNDTEVKTAYITVSEQGKVYLPLVLHLLP
jgi:hypothetical protein